MNISKILLLCSGCGLLNCLNVNAQRPIIQTKYTADPAPMVYNDTVFLYTTHDEDDAEGFKMQDWLLYTSTDMVNWTDHGVVASLKSFDWVKRDNGAWAEQVVERNGKFYMYWGNPNCYYVKLNEDMISYSGDIVKLKETPEHYQEGPWFYKRNGHYYLAFASTCCPEGIGYAMSDSPTGPWKTKGYIMRPTERTRGNHPGIMDYKGKSYVFGLNYDLLKLETNTHYERRSVSVAEMHYNEDGTIQEVPYWADTKLEQIGTFNPFRKVEAETMAWGYGLKTAPNADKSLSVVDVNNGEYICVRGVNFGKNKARRFEVSALPLEGGNLKIRLDAPDGKIVGNVNIPQGNETSKYELYSCEVNAVSGIHDLYLSFEGENNKDLFELDYWKF